MTFKETNTMQVTVKNLKPIMIPLDIILKSYTTTKIGALAITAYKDDDLDTFKSLITHKNIIADGVYLSEIVSKIINTDDIDTLLYIKEHCTKYVYEWFELYMFEFYIKVNIPLKPKINAFIKQETLKPNDCVLAIEAYKDKLYEKTREIIKNGTFNDLTFNQKNEYFILGRIFMDNDDVCMFAYLCECHPKAYKHIKYELDYALNKKAKKIIIWMIDNDWTFT